MTAFSFPFAEGVRRGVEEGMGSLDVDASGDCMTIEEEQDYIAEEGGTVRLSSEVITECGRAECACFKISLLA